MTTVAGIEIPSTSPIFLAGVAFHVAVGLCAVIAGIIAMLSGIAPGHHPTFGTIYYWSLSAVVVSATALAVVRWADDYHLFVLGVLAFTAATLGARLVGGAGTIGHSFTSSVCVFLTFCCSLHST